MGPICVAHTGTGSFSWATQSKRIGGGNAGNCDAIGGGVGGGGDGGYRSAVVGTIKQND